MPDDVILSVWSHLSEETKELYWENTRADSD